MNLKFNAKTMLLGSSARLQLHRVKRNNSEEVQDEEEFQDVYNGGGGPCSSSFRGAGSGEVSAA